MAEQLQAMTSDQDVSYEESIEKLFQAMDIIAKQRTSEMEFDKTIKAKVIDASKSDKGEYLVSDGSTTFTAYAAAAEYEKNMNVLVSIPNGDYNNQKMITAKNMADALTPFRYVNPLNSFIDITGNLIDELDGGDTYKGIRANGDQKVLWQSNDFASLKRFDKLAIGVNFKTNLGKFHLIKGSYGVRLDIVTSNPNLPEGNNYGTKQFFLTTDDMYGDPYNFGSYIRQEKVFDISDVVNIISMKILLVQNNDFENQEDGTDIYKGAALEKIQPNIFASNVYLSAGFDTNRYTEDALILDTRDSAYYSEELKQPDGAGNIKNITARFVHFEEDGRIIVADTIPEIKDLVGKGNNSKLQIHWYRYSLDPDVKDSLAGYFWIEDEYYFNKLNYSFNPNLGVGQEKIKAILEYPSREYVITTFKNSNTNYSDLVSSDPINEKVSTLFKELLHAGYFYENQKGLKEWVNRTEQDIIKDIYNESQQCTDSPKLEKMAKLIEEIQEVKRQIKFVYSDSLDFMQPGWSAESAAIDLVNGLKISTDGDGFGGVYNIYGVDGKIREPMQASKMRELIAVFNSLITKDNNLDTAEKITWYIPLDRSMIQNPQAGQEYDELAKQITIYTVKQGKELPIAAEGANENCRYACISRWNDLDTSSSEAGDSAKSIATQKFRIKDFYDQNATNNTIYCSVEKNSRIYTTSIVLYFGTSGANGTNATFMLNMYQVQKSQKQDFINTEAPAFSLKYAKNVTNSIGIVPKILDYNNNDITKQFEGKDISYSWFSGGDGIAIKQMGRDAILTLTGSDDIFNHKNSILKVTAKFVEVTEEENDDEDLIDGNVNIKTRNITLEAYLPIPISRIYDENDDTEFRYSGPSQVMYSDMGTNPVYSRAQIGLRRYSILTGEEDLEYNQDFTWNISVPQDLDKYYPHFINKSSEFVAPNIYFSKCRKDCSIIGYLDTKTPTHNDIVWIQPVFIDQNRFGSSTFNNWDGSFQINEQSGTILSTMLAAGKKEDDNSFSGVVMGDVKAGANFTPGNKDGMGLYGFEHGQQSFGFNIDGTAFIGKSGHGRIEMDGNNGTIQSGNFVANEMGMKIDLDGPERSQPSSALYMYGPNGAIEFDTGSNREALFSIQGHLYENSDHQKIRNPLLYISSNTKEAEYYLQSENYQGIGKIKVGTKLDIKKGIYTSYGEYGEVQISPQTASENDKVPPVFFTLSAKENREAPAKEVIKIAGGDEPEFLIQSMNFVNSKDSDNDLEHHQGTKLNLQTGQYISSGSGGKITINPSAIGSSPIFQLEGNISSEDGKYDPKSLMVVSKNNFYLQSASQNTKLDLSNGRLFIKATSEDEDSVDIYPSYSSYHFLVKASGQEVLKLGRNNNFLRSVNYASSTDSERYGLLLDINTGKFVAINKSTDKERKITIDPTGNNNLFVITADEKNLINIGTSDYYLQSYNYQNDNDKKKGMRISLKDGSIIAGDFKQNGNNWNLLQITPGDNSSIFSIQAKRASGTNFNVATMLNVGSGNNFYLKSIDWPDELDGSPTNSNSGKGDSYTSNSRTLYPVNTNIKGLYIDVNSGKIISQGVKNYTFNGVSAPRVIGRVEIDTINNNDSDGLFKVYSILYDDHGKDNNPNKEANKNTFVLDQIVNFGKESYLKSPGFQEPEYTIDPVNNIATLSRVGKGIKLYLGGLGNPTNDTEVNFKPYLHANEFELLASKPGYVQGQSTWNFLKIDTNDDNYPFNINNIFYIGWDGRAHMTGATVSGTITATSGQIGGFTIGETSISGNGFFLSSSSSSAAALSLGNAFSVSAAGHVTATSATIGGWTVGPTSISNGNVGLGSGGIYGGTGGSYFDLDSETGKLTVNDITVTTKATFTDACAISIAGKVGINSGTVSATQTYDLWVAGQTYLGGRLVIGTNTGGDASISPGATIYGDCVFNGGTGGKVTMTGETTITGKTTIDGDLIITDTKETTLGGAVNISGQISVNNAKTVGFDKDETVTIKNPWWYEDAVLTFRNGLLISYTGGATSTEGQQATFVEHDSTKSTSTKAGKLAYLDEVVLDSSNFNLGGTTPIDKNKVSAALKENTTNTMHYTVPLPAISGTYYTRGDSKGWKYSVSGGIYYLRNIAVAGYRRSTDNGVTYEYSRFKPASDGWEALYTASPTSSAYLYTISNGEEVYDYSDAGSFGGGDLTFDITATAQ